MLCVNGLVDLYIRVYTVKVVPLCQMLTKRGHFIL